MGDDLEAKAQDFAAELNDTLTGVLGAGQPTFFAEASPITKGGSQRIAVNTLESQLVPLHISEVQCLGLLVEFECSWDSAGNYLAVKKAKFAAFAGDDSQPLFRYEFVDGMQATIPSAHLHVHAHRDEFLFAMFRGTQGKPRTRAKAVTGVSGRSAPRLSDVHFPLGGARMRPCLEDVLQMMHTEFAIDVEPGFQAFLDRGRVRWRKRQIGAAVRDAPAEAVRVLTELGFRVDPPPGGIPGERVDRLKQV